MSGAVPELRFPEFTGPIKPVKLSEVATFSKGKGVSKSDIDPNGPLPCIRYGELYTVYGTVIDDPVSRTSVPAKDLILSKGGEVIVPASGETAKDIATAAVVKRPGVAMGGDLNIIRSDHDGAYLASYLSGRKRMALAAMAQGNSVVHLYAAQLGSLDVHLPELQEERKVSKFLSNIDAKLAALREKADGLRQFKTGLMQRLFSQELRFTREDGSDFPDWDEKPFSEIATRAGEQFDPRKENGKPRVIELEHLESGSGKILSSADIDGQISLKNRFRSGDVLFGKLRPYLRKFARPDFDGVCSSEIWVLRGRKCVSNSFLYALVQSPMFSQVVNISSGSKMPRADWKTITGVDFPVPCPDEQARIADALSALDAKIDAVTDQITHMETFKKGLLQKMFV